LSMRIKSISLFFSNKVSKIQKQIQNAPFGNKIKVKILLEF